MRALAADGDQVAFAAAPTKADCRDRVFIWQKLPPATFQLGKNQRCASRTASVKSVAVSGGRALWLSSTGGRTVDWQLWTATTTKKTPRLLEFITRGPDDPQPIVLGVAGDGLLPYAVNTTVTVLKANGSTAFTWAASAPVVALTAAGGRVAVAEQGGRVTVLDAHGKILSVDLYASDVNAVFFVTKGLLVQRGVTLELRRGADAHEFAMTADAHLHDAGGNGAPGRTGSSCTSYASPTARRPRRTRDRRRRSWATASMSRTAGRSRSEPSVRFVPCTRSSSSSSTGWQTARTAS